MGHFPELPALFPDAGILKYRGMEGTQLPDLGFDSCVRHEATTRRAGRCFEIARMQLCAACQHVHPGHAQHVATMHKLCGTNERPLSAAQTTGGRPRLFAGTRACKSLQ